MLPGAPFTIRPFPKFQMITEVGSNGVEPVLAVKVIGTPLHTLAALLIVRVGIGVTITDLLTVAVTLHFLISSEST